MTQLAINGGTAACDVQWPTWPIWDERERAGLLEVLESGKWWYGERVQQFEADFAAFQGTRYGVTASSGTTALETALQALDIGPGDEVILPPYTFIATATAVLRVDAIPVFADIEPNSMCLDPEDVKRKMSPRTKAILPVHFGGYVANMDRLNDIARKHNLIVIEDACHSWGSQWRGQGTGGLGRCGVFSFQVSKNISSGEGGIILTNDEALAARCRSITNCGRLEGGAWYEHENLGSNLRLTEFQVALLQAQLTRLEAHTFKRQANAALITEALRHTPGICVIEDDTRMTRRSYHLYMLRLDLNALGVSRERFVQALVAEGVPASAGYTRPIYKNAVFQNLREMRANPGIHLDYTQVDCPVTEQVCDDAIWLTHMSLLVAEPQIRQMIAAIQKVAAHVKELR